MFDCKSIFSPQFKANKSGKTITCMYEDEEWKSRLRYCKGKQKFFLSNDLGTHASIIAIVTHIPIRFGFHSWMKNDENGMILAGFYLPVTGVWHKTSVLLSFSAMKKYVSKCDSRTMTYLFCILDLYLPCCTPFFTAVCVCLCFFSLLIFLFVFIAATKCWRDDQIKKREEKWMNRQLSCAYITHLGWKFFSSLAAVIIITVDLMVFICTWYMCALLALLLCQRYSQRRCGCCHFSLDDDGMKILVSYIHLHWMRWGERERDYDVFSRLPQWIFYDAIIWLWLWLSERSLFSPSRVCCQPLASFFIQLLLTNKQRPLLLPQRQ